MAPETGRLGTAMLELSCCDAVHQVRKLVVGGDVVELRRQLVVDRRPRVAGVEADTQAPPSSQPIMRSGLLGSIQSAWLSPCGVWNSLEGLAAVDRLPGLHVHHEHRVGVGRVGDDVHVVPGPPAELGLRRDLSPRSRRGRRSGTDRACGPRPRRSRTRGPTGPARRRRRSCRACPSGMPGPRADVLPGVAAVASTARARCRARRCRSTRTCGAPARSWRRGSAGCSGRATTSTAPARSLTCSTSSHVSPPSFERYRPRSGLSFDMCPSAAT